MKILKLKTIMGNEVILTYDFRANVFIEYTVDNKKRRKFLYQSERKIISINKNGKDYHCIEVDEVLLTFDENSAQQIEEFFKDIKEHTIEINLGPCYNSDYNCHWWRGDDRTDKETIIKESAEILKCCYKKEIVEEHARKEVENFFKMCEINKQKTAEWKEKVKQAFEEAKRTGKDIALYSYTVECDDENEACDVDTIVVYACPDGTRKEVRYHNW